MRICFVGHLLGRNPGYITTQGQIVSDLLASEGHQVTSVSSKINRAARLSEIVLTLVRGFRKFDIVVLETFSGLSFVMADVASLVCRAVNLPLVMVLHGGNLPKFAAQRPRWVKRVLSRADRIAAPSEFIAAHFRSAGYDVEVIPNVVDLNGYPFRERTSIGPNLIWMRSFDPIYNPEMAVRVLASVRKSRPDATLTMAGTDKGSRAGVEKLVRELGLSESVRFAGFLDHDAKVREFSRADIYINTTHVDNMPVSVIEARVMGLPVVSTNVGGIPYMISDGDDGFLVEDNDHEAMARKVLELIGDADIVGRVSRRGREIAARSDWSRVRGDWEELFTELLAPAMSRKIKLGAADQQC